MATESIAGTAAWLDGQEIINDARTRAYIEQGLGPAGLSVVCDDACTNIYELIGCFPEMVELDQYVDLPGVAGNYISTPDTVENSLGSPEYAARLAGVSGTYISAPDSVALSIIGDIDVRAKLSMDTWIGTEVYWLSKWTNTGAQTSYILGIHTAGQILFYWTNAAGASFFKTSTANVPFIANQVGYIRATLDVDNGAAGNTVTFYTSNDGNNWTILGAPIITAGVTDIKDSTSIVTVGPIDAGTGSARIRGTFYSGEILNGINNLLVANPDFTTSPWQIGDVASTARADSLGNVWTLNGRAEIRRLNEVRSMRLNGTANTRATAPDAAALDIVGDIDIRALVAMDDWTPAANNTLISKWSAIPQLSYRFGINTAGQPFIGTSSDGTAQTTVTSTVAVGASDGSLKWVRATRVSATGSCEFFSSNDGVTWTSLSVVAGADHAIFSSTSTMQVGAQDAGAGNITTGNVFYAEIRNGIAGTIVANPSFNDWIAGDVAPTARIDGTGNTWTLAGAAVIQRAYNSDLDIRIQLSLDDWTPSAIQTLIAKRGGASTFHLRVETTGSITWALSLNGVTSFFFTSSVATGFVDGSIHWIRSTIDVDNGSGGRTANFYTSNDGVSWVLLGVAQISGKMVFFDSTESLAIGMLSDGVSLPLAGNIYHAEVRRGIDGPIVASFDSNDTLATSINTPNTVVSSETGETWTINGALWTWGNGAYLTPSFPFVSPAAYTDPVTDGAPWISQSYPESEGFLGMLVEDFEGLGSTLTRAVTPVITEGAVLGRLRAAERTLTWKGWLVGRTCCSVAYGLRWLTRALSGSSACAGSCTTQTLDLIMCCPEVIDDFPDDDPGQQVSGLVGGGYAGTNIGSPSYAGPDETVSDTEQIFPTSESINDRAFRTIYNVGITEGPLITDQRKVNCGCGCSEIMQVEFTLVAEKPYLYQNSIVVADEQPIVFGVSTTIQDLDECTLPDCSFNPFCPIPATPPLPVLTDNCYVDPAIPTATRITVPRAYWPDLSEVVPIITIYSGDQPMHSTSLAFFESNTGDPCGDYVNNMGDASCNSLCGTLRIPYIPELSTFVIDGRVNKMSLVCRLRSNTIPGEKITSGPWGWPVFNCFGFCFELVTDQSFLNPNATVSFELVPRSL